MIRIGVVADTHVGGRLPDLPDEIPELLAGVDLIVHAGDVTASRVLERLREVAPLVAVRGNHDGRPGMRHLPYRVVVRAGGVSVGVTHGHRRRAVELASIATTLVDGPQRLVGFDRTMRRRFGDVDCIVVGHLHQPIHRMVDGVLLFSPGAVYAPEADPDFDWLPLRSRAYRRYRRALEAEAWRPTIGMLEIADGRVGARAIPLTRPLRSAA